MEVSISNIRPIQLKDFIAAFRTVRGVLEKLRVVLSLCESRYIEKAREMERVCIERWNEA